MFLVFECSLLTLPKHTLREKGIKTNLLILTVTLMRKKTKDMGLKFLFSFLKIFFFHCKILLCKRKTIRENKTVKKKNNHQS